ncbi:MAG TPA: DMT family transporter [Alphaproteobacteria bacterium]|nr:DMT family transporter [Alphaproteobacteria bacterium]
MAIDSPTLAPRSTTQSVLAGVVMMVCAAALFSVMNALVKLLSAEYSTVQIIWARTLSHLVFVLLLFAPRRRSRLVRSERLPDQIARSFLLLFSTCCFFTGVKFMPLAQAASITFAAPFFVVALAAMVLGERPGPASWIAIALGFIGVLIIIRPGAGVFHWASLLFLASAFFYAIYQLLTRRVARFDAPETSVVYSALVGALVMSLVVPFFWSPPSTLTSGVLLFGLGIFGGLGHYCVARALDFAPASIVSPFHYLQLIGATAMGFMMFAEVPDLWTIAGAAVIIASGLSILWDESKRASRPR